MKSIALLTTLGLLQTSDEGNSSRFAYAVIKQSTTQQSAVYISAKGDVFGVECDPDTVAPIRPGAGVSADDWQAMMQSPHTFLEHESDDEIARLARASAMLSNETLMPLQQQTTREEQVTLLTVDDTQSSNEPVIVFQDGHWRRDNAADEARIVKAFLLNKARKYL